MAKVPPGPQHSLTSRRLGKPELGRYAFEDRMPDRIFNLLGNSELEHRANETSGIVQALIRLGLEDAGIEKGLYCHSAVSHVGKIRGEGNNFCGYRSIQMLISFVRNSDHRCSGIFEAGLPSILRLQSLIEDAWDSGFNEHCRVETGGIKGTRKHIGTPEAQALFRSIGINCKVNVFHDVRGGSSAQEALMDFVERYLGSAPYSQSLNPCIQTTGLSPIYLQRPRHSMVIVGIERRRDGARNLLVLDPAISQTKCVTIFDRKIKLMQRPNSWQRIYRRSDRQLRRYEAFETLYLTSK